MRRIWSRIVQDAHWNIVEPLTDWRLGIQTGTFEDEYLPTLPNAECNAYNVVSASDFKRALKHVDIKPGEDVFLDYGSGKGRALVLASRYPFRKIIGLEYSEELNTIARENLKRSRVRTKCCNIEIISCDATMHELPVDVTVIHIYNSFVGEMLKKTLYKIHESLLENNRKVTLLYMHPDNFEPIAHEFPWMIERIQCRCSNASKCTIYDCML